MTTEQLRLALVAILVVVVAFGMYLGWHFTHQETRAKCPVSALTHKASIWCSDQPG